MKLSLWIGLALLVAGLAVAALNVLGRYSGVTVSQEQPDTVAALLAPHLIETLPEGPGPFPTALLFSGCDGVRDNLPALARGLQAKGWASVIVDSHTPRGFSEFQVWRLICAGQLFLGSERAGDVAVALALVRERSYADPERIALIGASHGGWAILEFLSMADHGEVPFTLTGWPDATRADPLAGVRAAVLFYPYCGELSRAARRGWSRAVQVLFLLVDDDAIADEDDCLALASRQADRGLPVETVVFPGVTHGFDQQEKAPLSALSYSPQAAQDAIARAVAFVDAASLPDP